MSTNKINEQTFPVLACFDNNILNNSLQHMLENSGYEEESWASISKSFIFFSEKAIEINYITEAVHQKLLQTADFENARAMLSDSAEVTGLLLLPETIHSDFSNVPSYVEADVTHYPIDAILYSWLSIDNHDRLAGTFDVEDPWHVPSERTLLILPFCGDRITQATSQEHLISYISEYATEWREGDDRDWYGKILDYVMSYLILERSRKDLNIIKYQMEFTDNPYGNHIKILDFVQR